MKKNIITLKRMFAVFLSLLLILSSAVYSMAVSTSESWYIKRNADKRPLLQKNQEIIYKYDGYYIDKKLSDTSEKKVLYITFDAGYENGNISMILDILKDENVPAAFFILDNIVVKNKELVTRMRNEGHLVCNHTKDHKDISNCSNDEIKQNLLSLETLYTRTTGDSLDKFFRFPEGCYSEEALKCVQSLGYKTIFWSFAYEDWDNENQPSCEKATSKILKNTHNGAVILLHPTSETNKLILKDLIREWKNLGYTFGTLYELVE